MNLFWKNLFGVLTPTAKFEAITAELISSMIRYKEVEKSVELEEYKKLLHEVKSASFIENKKTLQNRKYKDTEEFRDTRKFNKLKRISDIELYYQVLKSTELDNFLKFKSSSEYENLGDKKKVKASEKLQHLKRFERSKEYKNYTRFHDSFVIREFEQLKALVNSPEFKKKNEFWANPHRWQTTPEYVKEHRFYELAKNPDISFYLNEKPERFDQIKNRRETFVENFNGNTLDKSRWDFGFHYKNSYQFSNHSFANEKQANNGGKNISVENGILQLATKHEKAKAKAWHPTKGFIEKDFEYTSDVANCAKAFRQRTGTFSVKLRCSGNVNHAFWLGSDGKLPHINIFHFDGKKIKVGNAGKDVIDGIVMKGMKPSQFHIYSLIWTEKELIWKVNNLEVYRTAGNIPKEEMFMVFNSFIPEKKHGSTGLLEIDWIKVYDK
jgi:hypothetical protein